jgi:hypothetical protein
MASLLGDSWLCRASKLSRYIEGARTYQVTRSRGCAPSRVRLREGRVSITGKLRSVWVLEFSGLLSQAILQMIRGRKKEEGGEIGKERDVKYFSSLSER